MMVRTQGGSCVECNDCMASSKLEFGRKETFLEAWNHRIPYCETQTRAKKSEGKINANSLHTASRETLPEALTAEASNLPADVVELVLRIGRAEWAATPAKSAEEHASDLINSIRITDEHFKIEGPHRMDGLYIEGTETIICHSGTSPNSPGIAKALTGAWNRMYDEAAAQHIERARHG